MRKAPTATSVFETVRLANHRPYHSLSLSGRGNSDGLRPGVRLRTVPQPSILMMDMLGYKTGEATGHYGSVKCGVDGSDK
jgi:hypothetical protein